MTAGRCARTVRTGVFAAICVTLAALGHVVMSGTGVPWWALLVALVMTAVVGWGLSAFERAGRTVETACVGIQVVLHVTLCLAQAGAHPGAGGSLPRRWLAYLLCSAPPTPDVRTGSMPPMPGMSSATSTAMHSMPGMGTPGHGMSAGSSAGMLAAHLLAAALCGGWLARGERVAFDAVRAVESWLAAPLWLPLPCTLAVPDHSVPRDPAGLRPGSAPPPARPGDHLTGTAGSSRCRLTTAGTPAPPHLRRRAAAACSAYGRPLLHRTGIPSSQATVAWQGPAAASLAQDCGLPAVTRSRCRPERHTR
ncbi:hypothetical protein [Streptomyces sp. SID2888]|uniref:hypothetical protein n=1 Tax=Streptomyces sp. SID2888 TaxID=2690256 RepID=UPI001F26ED89|nr:hypothetical protein [Streptomyces sp. SID2888]